MPASLPRVCDAVVLLWLAVFHHVLGIKYRFAQIAYDEHFFLNEGWSVLQGQIPYKDFQEFKPPVIFFANALGLALFGLEDLAYRHFLSVLSLAGFVAIAAALLSRRVDRVLVVGALMLMIDHFYDDGLHNGVINDAETLAVDFFLMGTGVLLTRTRWERTALVLGGALLALSPLSKEPMAFAVIAAWLTLLVLHRGEPERASSARSYVLFTTLGVAGLVLTWLVYMLSTGSLSWYILQLKLSFAYSENYAYQVGWSARSPRGGRFVEALKRLGKGYVNAAHFGVFVPLLAALAVLWQGRALVVLGSVAVFATALYGVSIGSGFPARYFIMAMAGTFFCVALGVLALDFYAKTSVRRFRFWVRASWLGLALVMTWPRFATEWTRYGKYKVPPSPVPQSDIALVHKHTQPGDKIWATDDPLLNVFSGRESAFLGGIVLDEIIGYYAGSTDEERLSIVREGLERNRPKLVVLGNTMVSARRKQRYMRALVLPFLREGGYVRLNQRFYLRPD